MIRMLHPSTLSARWLLLLLVGICCCLNVAVTAAAAARSEVERNLGSLQLLMESSAPVEETNRLLRRILIETVDFLDEAFYEALDDGSFQKVSCSIVTYQTATIPAKGNSGASITYTAKITLTGQATFLADTSVTQSELHALTVSAFDSEQENGRFFFERLAASDLSFLKNLQVATVTVNGHNALDDDMTSYPPPPPGSGTQQENDGDGDGGKPLAVWQIAVIAGAGAFVVVLCLALACICCMKVDDEMLNRNKDSSKAKLTVNTYSTGRSDDRNNNCELSSKSPSPVRSITSQDSSIFTYNPRSVRSTMTGTYSASGSTYFTNNTGLEMDLAAWQSSTQLAAHHGGGGSSAPQHASFGDLSAIEPRNKKDLSLIQEEAESSAGSAASTPSRATNGSSRHDQPQRITESALNDLVRMERGMLRNGDEGDDDSEEEDSTIFVLKSSGSGEASHATNGSRPGSHNNDNGAERLSLTGNRVMDELQELSHQIDAYRTQQYY